MAHQRLRVDIGRSAVREAQWMKEIANSIFCEDEEFEREIEEKKTALLPAIERTEYSSSFERH